MLIIFFFRFQAVVASLLPEHPRSHFCRWFKWSWTYWWGSRRVNADARRRWAKGGCAPHFCQQTGIALYRTVLCNCAVPPHRSPTPYHSNLKLIKTKQLLLAHFGLFWALNRNFNIRILFIGQFTNFVCCMGNWEHLFIRFKLNFTFYFFAIRGYLQKISF